MFCLMNSFTCFCYFILFYFDIRMLEKELLFLRDYFKCRLAMFSEVALLYMFSSWQHGNIFRELKYVLCCFQVLLIISVMPSQDFYPFHWPQLYFKVINATSYNKEPTCSVLVLMTLVPSVITVCVLGCPYTSFTFLGTSSCPP